MKQGPLRRRGGCAALVIRLFLQQCQGERSAECLASAHRVRAHMRAYIALHVRRHIYILGRRRISLACVINTMIHAARYHSQRARKRSGPNDKIERAELRKTEL